jgi:hypothetical protein
MLARLDVKQIHRLWLGKHRDQTGAHGNPLSA